MESITLYLPNLISGAISTIFNVGLIAFIGFLFWLWKRHISKQDKAEEKEEEKGPLLYKKEHDLRAEESHDEIIKAITSVRTEQKADMGELRKESSAGLRRVHERIDKVIMAEK